MWGIGRCADRFGKALSLHCVRFAFATENVARFLRAPVFALRGISAAADVGARLVAADDLLLGRAHWFFLLFEHYQHLLLVVSGRPSTLGLA
jgi:hypothetical protein